MEIRKTWAYRLDDPVQLGLFGARTLVMTWRQFEHLSGPKKGEKSKPELVFHASSMRVDDAHRTAFFADAVRKQWAIESKYHARRDGAYCEDIRTRRCGANVTGALMLARTPTFVFFAESETDNCQEFKETMQADKDEIFRLVTSCRWSSRLN